MKRKKFFLISTLLFMHIIVFAQQQTNTYEYDKLNRLVRVVTPVSVTTYSYDALGNRTAKRKRIDVTSVPEVPRNNEFKVYPNPAKEQVTIECPESSIGQNLIMADLNGRVILKREITSAKQALYLDGIAPGLYFISISGNKESMVYVHKLIKQ